MAWSPWHRHTHPRGTRLKATRKRMNAGKLQDERKKKFEALLALMEGSKRVNQWK